MRIYNMKTIQKIDLINFINKYGKGKNKIISITHKKHVLCQNLIYYAL